jgi:hypothetical protein
LCGPISREELVIRDPARIDDSRVKQRQDDVTAAEHEGAAPIERLEQRDGLPTDPDQQRQADQQNDERRQAYHPDPARDRARFRSGRRRDGR